MHREFFWLIIVCAIIGIIILTSKQTSVTISQIAFSYKENRFATFIEESRFGTDCSKAIANKITKSCYLGWQ